MSHSSEPDKNKTALPDPASTNATIVTRVLSLAAGVGVALVFYYLLYRIELPSKPFIYVAF